MKFCSNFVLLFVSKFLDDYSKAGDISTVVSYHIGSLPRLGLASKYLVDEVLAWVLEKIEKIIINCTYHK
jgi:hypothetical protein